MSVRDPSRVERAADPAVWLEDHGIRSVQVLATTLQGTTVGKRLAVDEFLATLPAGPGLPDTVLHQSVGGDYAWGWELGPWQGELRDVKAWPDLATLTAMPDQPGVASVLADLRDDEGQPLPVCPRTVLKTQLARLGELGYTVQVAFELEGTVFEESFAEARACAHRGLHPLGASTKRLCGGHPPRPYVEYADALTDELDRLGVGWTSWVNEGGLGQLEINFPPTEALLGADLLLRTRTAMRTVAESLGRSVSFMAMPAPRSPAGLHVHVSLWKDEENAFTTGGEPGSAVLDAWVGGIVSTMPAATSLMLPNPNSYRRLTPGHGAPTAPLWGRDNKTVALRVLTRSGAARLEHRLAGADANPYVVLAAVLAGGLAGMTAGTEPPPEFEGSAWGLPYGFEPHLPATIAEAARALEADEALRAQLGEQLVRYWVGSRRWEWYAFHTSGADPRSISDWELRRYFENV